MSNARIWLVPVLLLGTLPGCMSPYRADRGAVFGGATGAGVGALVGSASGHPLAGAAIGAGVGALSGAAVGSALDNMEARNRAEIEARMGQPVPTGSVTTQDVIALSKAGVDDEIIAGHIRIHGVVAPPTTNDLITLRNNGVSPHVIQAMQQTPPVRSANAVPMQPIPVQPVPVVIEGGFYPPPPPPSFYRRHRPYGW